MQYKQLTRILIEIAEAVDAPRKVKLAALELLMPGNSLPKLGPYPGRAPERRFWRIASDCSQPARVRWAAVKSLLSVAALTPPPAKASTHNLQVGAEETAQLRRAKGTLFADLTGPGPSPSGAPTDAGSPSEHVSQSASSTSASTEARLNCPSHGNSLEPFRGEK